MFGLLIYSFPHACTHSCTRLFKSFIHSLICSFLFIHSFSVSHSYESFIHSIGLHFVFHRYTDLLESIPNDIKNVWYYQAILQKLHKYGRVSVSFHPVGVDLPTPALIQSHFVSVGSQGRVWGKCQLSPCRGRLAHSCSHPVTLC